MKKPSQAADAKAKSPKSTAAASSKMKQKDEPDIRVKTLLAPFKVKNGKSFRLKNFPTSDDRSEFDFDKEITKALLEDGIDDLQELQEKLYADNRWSVLLIFQAMDAAGKDSTIKAVMSGVNPQGCQVHSFKKPSEEELDHDFLWRTTKALPERGRIGIFNRSYYEEVLVVRVHPEILDKQRLPAGLVTEKIWKQRLKAIRQHEKFLSKQGTIVIKFFLNVGRDEQKKRLLARLDDPAKTWKFEAQDVTERGFWDSYMVAYEDAIRATARPHAPWYVIPADDKKFMRVAVMAAIRREMRKLDLAFPESDPKNVGKIAEARAKLEAS